MTETVRRIFIAEVMYAVAARYMLTKAQLLAPNRRWTVARQRHIGMYLARTLTGRSMQEIGRRFDRDHSTVVYAVHKIERRKKLDKILAFEIALLSAEITGRASHGLAEAANQDMQQRAAG